MATGSPDYYPKIIISATEEEQEKASVTDSETTVTFSDVVQAWLFYNDGPFPVHYSLATGVDTNNFKIPPGAAFMLDVPITNLYLICATGETATVFVTGVR